VTYPFVLSIVYLHAKSLYRLFELFPISYRLASAIQTALPNLDIDEHYPIHPLLQSHISSVYHYFTEVINAMDNMWIQTLSRNIRAACDQCLPDGMLVTSNMSE
jgi:hypothetical protein